MSENSDTTRYAMFMYIWNPENFTALENRIAAKIRRIDSINVAPSMRISRDVEHARVALNTLLDYLTD